MPLLNVYTSAQPLPEARASELLRQLSASVAKHLQKPEAYVMVGLLPSSPMAFAGTHAPSCYVEVRALGAISSACAKALTAAVTEHLSQAFGVPGDRIFVVFSEVEGRLWGVGGNTLG